MKWQTSVKIPPCLRPLDVGQSAVWLGSCFAHEIGTRWTDLGLGGAVNPVGPLYSPHSITAVAMHEGRAEAVEGPLGWHTWLTSTAFTRSTKAEAEAAAEEALSTLSVALQRCHHLTLTLGTNHTYRWLPQSICVANCHKHRGSEFAEADESIEEMEQRMAQMLAWLHGRNPQCIVTLTVSPYRYAGRGMHQSQLAKARLLLLCERLEGRFPFVQYFPAYELMLDELRDYRFYAPDMLHPSATAVDYIWERFGEWMTPELRDDINKRAQQLRQQRHETHVTLR